MLEKMGWTDGKGLGADESGETSHIKVKKRATNLGKFLLYSTACLGSYVLCFADLCITHTAYNCAPLAWYIMPKMSTLQGSVTLLVYQVLTFFILFVDLKFVQG